jgi:hypothetical protein
MCHLPGHLPGVASPEEILNAALGLRGRHVHKEAHLYSSGFFQVFLELINNNLTTTPTHH